jgi:glycine cleavage system H protein
MKKFTKDHEWISVEGDTGTIGITDYAQKQLGDIVYISLTKEIGDDLQPGDDFAEIESVKSVSQVFAPITGSLQEFNTDLEDEENTAMVNEDPYGKGWIVKITIADPSQLDDLMDESAYDSYTASL